LQVSIDPETFRQMFAASNPDLPEVDPQASDDELEGVDFIEEPPADGDFIEPPIRSELIEPPIRRAEPPPSKKELEAKATDDLMKIAAEEEKELKKIHKDQRSKDTITVVCPNGCRIRVKEKYRGKHGKCPRCQAEFLIPKKGQPEKE
jgi:hypothetical protein